jgi:hypothetical protein
MIKRDWLLIAIGAQVFHTISHIILSLSNTLPLHFFFFTITKQFNMLAILLNVVISGLLIWWLKKSE